MSKEAAVRTTAQLACPCCGAQLEIELTTAGATPKQTSDEGTPRDLGFGASHGYDRSGNSGPTGPGDAPAGTLKPPDVPDPPSSQSTSGPERKGG